MASFEGPTDRLYRKKPVTVQALNWDGTQMGAGIIIEWLEEMNANPDKVRYIEKNESPNRDMALIELDTNQGVAFAQPGWWIVWGTANDVYPCAPEVFDEVFEKLVTV